MRWFNPTPICLNCGKRGHLYNGCTTTQEKKDMNDTQPSFHEPVPAPVPPHAPTLDEGPGSAASYDAGVIALIIAAQDFIHKVDSGRARSIDSYRKFAEALALINHV